MLFCAGITVVICSGCEDLLPEYHQPVNVIKAEFVGADDHIVKFWANFDDEYGKANYVSYGSEIYTPFTVTFGIKNTYEETIQATAAVRGSVVIYPEANPNFSEEHLLSNENLKIFSKYDQINNILTLNPNESFFIKTKLDFKLADIVYMHFFAQEKSRTIINYKGRLCYEVQFSPMTAVALITIQLADNFPPVTSLQKFPITFYGLIPIPPGNTL
ncbi:MAG: hypothetical protein WCW35_05950 [Bacteroidota bacterium]